MKTGSKIPLQDIYLSAYLDYRGAEPILIKENTRVIFHFANNQQTLKLLAEYNTNPSIPLMDYVSHLRKLRSKMISMRG